ncbi:hypothetical protein LI014_02400 [Clostridium perfringens]|uniref:hypothetical protein n=1 Tax=Clostridium perfringens TaxID=1502 RepID=UPI002246D063|nr:hypothetical protein [Clostridium perfringens]MCX0396236.1 hypothetical protein [Clostridium perfringens]
MATSSIFKNIELDKEGLNRFFKAIDKSKKKQIKRHKWNEHLCDYCHEEVELGKQHLCKIGDELYSGHSHCMMKLIKEVE